MSWQDQISACANIVSNMAIYIYDAGRDLGDRLREVWVTKDHDSTDPSCDRCRNKLGRVVDELTSLAVSGRYKLRLGYFIGCWESYLGKKRFSHWDRS